VRDFCVTGPRRLSYSLDVLAITDSEFGPDFPKLFAKALHQMIQFRLVFVLAHDLKICGSTCRFGMGLNLLTGFFRHASEFGNNLTEIAIPSCWVLLSGPSYEIAEFAWQIRI